MFAIEDGPAVIAKRVTERQPEFRRPTIPFKSSDPALIYGLIWP